MGVNVITARSVLNRNGASRRQVAGIRPAGALSWRAAEAVERALYRRVRVGTSTLARSEREAAEGLRVNMNDTRNHPHLLRLLSPPMTVEEVVGHPYRYEGVGPKTVSELRKILPSVKRGHLDTWEFACPSCGSFEQQPSHWAGSRWCANDGCRALFRVWLLNGRFGWSTPHPSPDGLADDYDGEFLR